jgi:hypothetical protein
LLVWDGNPVKENFISPTRLTSLLQALLGSTFLRVDLKKDIAALKSVRIMASHNEP